MCGHPSFGASLFLGYWRKILEELGHCLIEPLHILFLIAAWIQGVGCLTAPNELLCHRIVDIKDQRSVLDRAARDVCHATPAQTAAHTEATPLPFLVNRALVADVHIGRVCICL